MFDILKRLYDGGVYTEDDLKEFVKSEKITKDEFFRITGKEV